VPNGPGTNGDANGASDAPGPTAYGLGSRPEFDMGKAEELCGLEEDQLSLLSLDRLTVLQESLVSTSAQASALLAWLLQLKDAQTQDSVTYNGMISEFISNAAKAKSAQATGSGGVFRRASGRRPGSNSGSNTPRRVASPAMRVEVKSLCFTHHLSSCSRPKSCYVSSLSNRFQSCSPTRLNPSWPLSQSPSRLPRRHSRTRLLIRPCTASCPHYPARP